MIQIKNVSKFYVKGAYILGIIFGILSVIINKYLYKNQNKLADKII